MARKRGLPFAPRQMMELAVKVMRKSVQEKRGDKSPSPRVGAVLAWPNGTFVTAARGELRDGNHAEFTLLERKCAGQNVEGCTLFTTLEPCLERAHPKKGCARHITGARIKEVYVGIEDDNPAVAGKGIEHLRRNGVKIHMFDRDLQEEILQENEKFLTWARKQPIKRKEEKIKLSKYEDSVTAVRITDLSKNALERYRKKAAIRSKVGTAEFSRLLQQQGLIVKGGPSGFGLLLFGKQPRNALPEAGLLARAELSNGQIARREFGDALVLIPTELEKWLKTVLPSTIDRRQMERYEAVDLPFEMIREAVVNALVHRDYDLKGQKCQLVIDVDKIVVKSPGGPIPPITLEQLQNFSAPIKSRNPVLHYVFARMGLAEEQGLGLEQSLKRMAEKLKLPLPTFAMEGDYLVLTIYRHRAAAVETLPSRILRKLSDPEREGWKWLSGHQFVRAEDYAKAMSLPLRTAQNHLRRFTLLRLVRRTGSARASRYMVGSR